MGAARIGRIRMKTGGAEVRLIRQETPNGDGKENWAGRLVTSARGAAEHCAESGPLTGFVIAAFYADGGTYTAFRWGDESPANRNILPAYVAEIVRRDVITEPEANRVVNRANGFED